MLTANKILCEQELARRKLQRINNEMKKETEKIIRKIWIKSCLTFVNKINESNS